MRHPSRRFLLIVSVVAALASSCRTIDTRARYEAWQPVAGEDLLAGTMPADEQLLEAGFRITSDEDQILTLADTVYGDVSLYYARGADGRRVPLAVHIDTCHPSESPALGWVTKAGVLRRVVAGRPDEYCVGAPTCCRPIRIRHLDRFTAQFPLAPIAELEQRWTRAVAAKDWAALAADEHILDDLGTPESAVVQSVLAAVRDHKTELAARAKYLALAEGLPPALVQQWQSEDLLAMRGVLVAAEAMTPRFERTEDLRAEFEEHLKSAPTGALGSTAAFRSLLLGRYCKPSLAYLLLNDRSDEAVPGLRAIAAEVFKRAPFRIEGATFDVEVKQCVYTPKLCQDRGAHVRRVFWGELARLAATTPPPGALVLQLGAISSTSTAAAGYDEKTSRVEVVQRTVTPAVERRAEVSPARLAQVEDRLDVIDRQLEVQRGRVGWAKSDQAPKGFVANPNYDPTSSKSSPGTWQGGGTSASGQWVAQDAAYEISKLERERGELEAELARATASPGPAATPTVVRETRVVEGVIHHEQRQHHIVRQATLGRDGKARGAVRLEVDYVSSPTLADEDARWALEHAPESLASALREALSPALQTLGAKDAAELELVRYLLGEGSGDAWSEPALRALEAERRRSAAK